MQLPDHAKLFDIIEVRFKSSRKAFFRNGDGLELHIGDVVVVDASPGHDVGVVSLTGELVRVQMNRRNVKDTIEIKKVLRKATTEDVDTWQDARKRETDTMIRARKIADSCNLQMKISDVEYQGDGNKATFFYTAEDRVDFRELIRAFAEAFRARIEMRQIGMRQEAGRLGGIGSCGRELCCSTWLSDFRSVSTSAARYQQLSLNPQKLAGQCGKLKCCLNFELDQYREAVKEFPPMSTKLETAGGRAGLFKIDIFKRLLYFTIEGQFGVSPVALGLDEVLDIIEMNKRGEKPANINEFVITETVEEEVTFLNDVGQDSLTRFDRSKSGGSNRRKRGNDGRSSQGAGNRNDARGSQTGADRRDNNRSRGPRPQGPRPEASGDAPNREQAAGGDNNRSRGPRPQGPRPEASGDAPNREQAAGGDNNRRSRPSRRKRGGGGNGPKPDGQGGGNAA